MLKSFAGHLPKGVLQGVVIITLVGAALLTWQDAPPTAYLVISGVGTHDRHFQGEVTETMTILDALRASALAGNIPFQFEINEALDVTQIRRLNDHALAGANEVTIFLNDNRIDSAKVHSIPLHANDRVTVKLP